jgi:hypothetical protein
MDFVDDDRLDVGEGVGGVRREHQVEALGRRDQQIRRAPQHRLALARRGVAGAHPDLRKVESAGRSARFVDVDPFGSKGDAGQWRAQVLLHVEREGPERRYVEDTCAHPAVVGGR